MWICILEPYPKAKSDMVKSFLLHLNLWLKSWKLLQNKSCRNRSIREWQYWLLTLMEQISFLSTSNEPIYKVFNDTECVHSRATCDPAVSLSETFQSSLFYSRLQMMTVAWCKTFLYYSSAKVHLHINRFQNFSTSVMKRECADSECLFAFYGGETPYHKYLIGLQFYNVFLFFWCANFVTALGQMTLAGAFASYYWAFVKPDDIPAFPVFSSLGRSLRFVVAPLSFLKLLWSSSDADLHCICPFIALLLSCLRYHTGTLAFGSLILSIIQIIRVLLEYLDHKLKGLALFLVICFIIGSF